MNNFKKYIRDLNIVKNNLTKFYYNSSSEWLKPEIINCITAVNMEIALYTKKERERKEFYIKNQITIFDFVGESDY